MFSKRSIRNTAVLVVLAAVLACMLALRAALPEHAYADAKEIKEVALTVKAPAPGSDSDTDPVVTVADGAPYEVVAKGWISSDGNQEPPTYFKCEAGQTYKLWLTLKAASSYRFPDDPAAVQVTLDGGETAKTTDCYTFGDYSALVLQVEVKCKSSEKETNPLTVKAKSPSVKYSKLKKAAQTLALSKVITIGKYKGTLTFVKVSGSSKISVDKETGKVKIKKGTKKGTYKIVVKVTASGDSDYAKITKKVTVKIKVK